MPNSFGENVCENANTRALGGLHVVVLAHLLRRWSLRGGEVLGIPLPPAELARRIRRNLEGRGPHFCGLDAEFRVTGR